MTPRNLLCRNRRTSQGHGQKVTSGNISKTVQDRYVVIEPLIGSETWPSEQRHFRWPWVNLKVIHLLQAFQMRFIAQLYSTWQDFINTEGLTVARHQSVTSYALPYTRFLMYATMSDFLSVKAKFHYATWFGAGSNPNSITLSGSKLVRSWFEPDNVMEFSFEPAPNQLA